VSSIYERLDKFDTHGGNDPLVFWDTFNNSYIGIHGILCVLKIRSRTHIWVWLLTPGGEEYSTVQLLDTSMECGSYSVLYAAPFPTAIGTSCWSSNSPLLAVGRFYNNVVHRKMNTCKKENSTVLSADLKITFPKA